MLVLGVLIWGITFWVGGHPQRGRLLKPDLLLISCPSSSPPPSPGECRKLVRDALRLTLWPATGSTGDWLVTQIVARKRPDCGA